MNITARLYARQLESIISDLKSLVDCIDIATDEDVIGSIGTVAENHVKHLAEVGITPEIVKIEEGLRECLKHEAIAD